MIKPKTIAKRKVKKELPIEYVKLELKFKKSLELIKESNTMIGNLQIEIEKYKQEISELKEHWTYKLRKLLRW